MKNLLRSALAIFATATCLSASAVTFTVNVEQPEGVIVKVDYVEQTVTKGANKFTSDSSYPYLSISGVDPYCLASVTKNGDSMYVSYNSCSIYPDDGDEFTVTLKNMVEARTASCNLNVDDASKVRAQISNTAIGSRTLELVNGDNVVMYDPDTESSMSIASASYSEQLYSVTLNETPLTASYGTYSVPLAQDCNIVVTAIIPDIDITFTIEYADEASYGFVTSVTINDVTTDVAPEGGTFNLKAGQKVAFTVNDTDYKLDEATLNGNSYSWYGSSSEATLMESSTLVVRAHKYATYSYTVIVPDPKHIKLFRGYSYSNDVIELNSTENHLEISETSNRISWQIQSGVVLTEEGVTIDGEKAGEYTDYAYVTDGMVIVFHTAEVNLDKEAVVWINDKSQASYSMTMSSDVDYKFDIASDFETGYNQVAFSDLYNPFNLSINGYNPTPENSHVYVNGEEVASRYEFSLQFGITLQNKDVVKIFLCEEPVECNVTFDIDDEIQPDVVRDLIVPVENLGDALTVFNGTQFEIANTKSSEAMNVSVNDVPLAPEADGSYKFLVTDPDTKVSVVKDTESGINSVEAGAATREVYNLQGMKVRGDFESLPAGVYVINGKKVVK